MISLHSEIEIEEAHNDDGIHFMIHQFLDAAIQLTKFIKVLVNGLDEHMFKTPLKHKQAANFSSP
mgnify:CR=1 FL=1